MKVKNNSNLINKKKNALSTKPRPASSLLKPKTLIRKNLQNKNKGDVQKQKFQLGLALNDTYVSSHVEQTTKFKSSNVKNGLSVKGPHVHLKRTIHKFKPKKRYSNAEESLNLMHHEKPKHDKPKQLEGPAGKNLKPLREETTPKKSRKDTTTPQDSSKLKKKRTKKGSSKAKKGSKQKKIHSVGKLFGNQSPLHPDKVSPAVSALMKLVKDKSDSKTELLDLAQPIWMQVECIKIPICPTKQLRFKLPHPLITENSDILLITADKKGSKINPEKAVEHYTELLFKYNIHFILKVLPLRMLRKEYSQFEMRRKLIDQFDLILADAKIIKSLPSILGKHICYNHKMPIPVHLDRKDLKEHFHIAITKTQMPVKSNGHMSSVQVGHSKMSEQEITANIVEVSKWLNQLYPGGWKNIRSLNIKTSNTTPFPVYLSLLSPNMVRIPVEQRKKAPDVEGELSTQPGMKVVVRADGTVYLQKMKGEEEEQTEDSVDDEILKEAEKYMQTSKTVRYESDEDNSDKEADAVTAAVEREFLSDYNKNVTAKESGKDEEDDDEEEESSEEEENVLPIAGNKRKIKPKKNEKVVGKSPEKKQKRENQQQKFKGKAQKISQGGAPGSKGESGKRGSRGGKKNKLNKDQRKALIKRKKAGKK